MVEFEHLKRQLHARWQLESAGELFGFLGNLALDPVFGVIECGHNQVFEHFDFIGIDDGLVELDLLHVALAAERHGHHAAARRAGDLDRGETFLHLLHARLHLLRLFQHLAEIVHRKSSPSSGSSVITIFSAPSSVSAAGVSTAFSRTASILAPGKVSSTARTSGWFAASLRRPAARAVSCSRSVASPLSPETL